MNFIKTAIGAKNFAIILALGLSLTWFSGCASSSAPAKPASQQAAQAAQAATGHYINPAKLDLKALLPDPSKNGSPISRGEGDLMLAIQSQSPDSSRDRAKSEDKFTPWTYVDVLGANFAKARMPLTAAMLDHVEEDTHAITERAKEYWDRARPPKQDPRITPVLKVPTNASYPSGHATRAIVWARLLAELAPDKTEALRARARLVALDRVIAGVHYPTDVAAGMALGDAIADEFLASATFKADLEKARAEWAQVPQPQPVSH